MVENDYEKAVGIWSHKIGDIEHKIIPREGDNIRIARMMKNVQKNGIDWLYQEFNNLYFEMVTRDVPISEEKKPKLRLWIEKNQVMIQKEMLVIFGWQTKEQQDKLENMNGDDLKKLVNA
jgi:hypothetical protein